MHKWCWCIIFAFIFFFLFIYFNLCKWSLVHCETRNPDVFCVLTWVADFLFFFFFKSFKQIVNFEQQNTSGLLFFFLFFSGCWIKEKDAAEWCRNFLLIVSARLCRDTWDDESSLPLRVLLWKQLALLCFSRFIRQLSRNINGFKEKFIFFWTCLLWQMYLMWPLRDFQCTVFKHTFYLFFFFFFSIQNVLKQEDGIPRLGKKKLSDIVKFWSVNLLPKRKKNMPFDT